MNDEIIIDEIYTAEELEKRSYFMRNREAFPGFNDRVRQLRSDMCWANARALVSEYVLQ